MRVEQFDFFKFNEDQEGEPEIKGKANDVDDTLGFALSPIQEDETPKKMSVADFMDED